MRRLPIVLLCAFISFGMSIGGAHQFALVEIQSLCLMAGEFFFVSFGLSLLISRYVGFKGITLEAFALALMSSATYSFVRHECVILVVPSLFSFPGAFLGIFIWQQISFAKSQAEETATFEG